MLRPLRPLLDATPHDQISHIAPSESLIVRHFYAANTIDPISALFSISTRTRRRTDAFPNFSLSFSPVDPSMCFYSLPSLFPSPLFHSPRTATLKKSHPSPPHPSMIQPSPLHLSPFFSFTPSSASCKTALETAQGKILHSHCQALFSGRFGVMSRHSGG